MKKAKPSATGTLMGNAARAELTKMLDDDEEDVINSYTEVMSWVQAQDQFSDAARAGFAAGADGWLVAYARSRTRIVVTHEVRDPSIRRKVPIPNVCEVFGVNYHDTFEMLRQLGVRFS